jgi:hypothetical protein
MAWQQQITANHLYSTTQHTGRTATTPGTSTQEAN